MISYKKMDCEFFVITLLINPCYQLKQHNQEESNYLVSFLQTCIHKLMYVWLFLEVYHPFLVFPIHANCSNHKSHLRVL